jgi:hypothetical protein
MLEVQGGSASDQMANGKWQMADGRWQMANGKGKDASRMH